MESELTKAIIELAVAKERGRIINEVKRLFDKQEEHLKNTSSSIIAHSVKYAAIILAELGNFIAEPAVEEAKRPEGAASICDCGCEAERVENICSSECDEKCQSRDHKGWDF